MFSKLWVRTRSGVPRRPASAPEVIAQGSRRLRDWAPYSPATKSGQCASVEHRSYELNASLCYGSGFPTAGAIHPSSNEHSRL